MWPRVEEGFGVWGVEFRVEDFGVDGSGDWGLEFRVLELMALGFGA